MLQGIEPRMLRAAERFGWSPRRLEIARRILSEGWKAADVAATLQTTYNTVCVEVCEARKQLRKQAQDECEPEAYTREALEEEDPEGLVGHAIALQLAMDGPTEFEDCLEAVESVGAY